MSPHPARNYPASLNVIYVSKFEHCSIESFIDQYLASRALQPDTKRRNQVIEALLRFSDAAPVMLYQINAWLDKRLGLKASHPDHAALIEAW